MVGTLRVDHPAKLSRPTKRLQNSSETRCENEDVCPTSLRGAIATKQSRVPPAILDCFASLAMTGSGEHATLRPTAPCEAAARLLTPRAQALAAPRAPQALPAWEPPPA